MHYKDVTGETVEGREGTWPMARNRFGIWCESFSYDSRQAVDWYHAKQHLWTVAHALYGEGTPEAQQWY